MIIARIRPIWSRLWPVLATVVAFTLFIAAYCGAINFNMTVFRAESGWYLGGAWGDAPRAFIRPMLVAPYNGHFTPLFFGTEFLQARIFGASETLWFWRQMLVLGVLATSICGFMSSALQFSNLERTWRLCISAMLAIVFIVQPTILELASWPFMAAQLMCIACGAFAMSNLAEFIRTNRVSSLSWGMAWGYASMHLFGVGLTISLVTLGAGATIALVQRLPRRHLFPIGIFGAATILHALVMLRSAKPGDGGTSLPLGEHVTRLGALFMGNLQGGVRSIWANGRFVWPNSDSYPVDAIYGITLLLAFVAISVILLARARRTQEPAPLLYGVLVGVATMAIAAQSALIVVRLQSVPDPAAITPFLFGSRYLVFPSFYLTLALPIILLPTVRMIGNWSAVPITLMGVGSAAATAAFFASVATLWPYMATSSDTLWHRVVEESRMQIDTSGIINDRRLVELDPEFQPELHQFKGLLEHELGCTGCVQLTAASQ